MNNGWQRLGEYWWSTERLVLGDIDVTTGEGGWYFGEPFEIYTERKWHGPYLTSCKAKVAAEEWSKLQ